MEIYALQAMSRVNGVVRFIDWIRTSNGYALVMERPPYSMDLFDFIAQNGPLDETVARNLFLQTIHAVLNMQNLGFVHRDLKDSNILIDLSTGQTIIIDLGCSAFVKEAPYAFIGGEYACHRI